MALVGVVTTTLAWGARADDATTPIRVRVDAPRSCATDDGFWRELSARTSRLERANESPSSLVVSVTEQPDGGARGVLRVERSGATSERTLTGATCQEVVRGLSLVAALAFDANAGSNAPEPANANANANADAAANAPATAPANPRAPSPAAEARRPIPVGAWRVGLGGGAAVIALGAPSSVAGYGGFAEIARDRRGLSPAVRVGLMHAEGGSPDGPARADLSWWLARAELCPVRLDLLRTVHARPCAGLETGALTGTPVGAARAQTKTRPWLAPSLSGRIEWEIYRVSFIEAEAGLTAPLIRDELVVDPTVSLYRAPALVPSARISAGVRFP
jgi:hypothetical protein